MYLIDFTVVNYFVVAASGRQLHFLGVAVITTEAKVEDEQQQQLLFVQVMAGMVAVGAVRQRQPLSSGSDLKLLPVHPLSYGSNLLRLLLPVQLPSSSFTSALALAMVDYSARVVH